MTKKSDSQGQLAVDFASPESLEIALKYFSLLETPPASFSSAIRSMLSDHSRKLDNLSTASRFFAQRLLRGRAIMTPMQHACALFKGRSDTKAMTARELLDSLKPDEAGALFGLFYYARKAKSISENPEEWQHISRHFELHISTGVLVGQAMPQIGLCLGMLVGGLPSLTLTTFLKHDLNGLKDYRRQLKSAHLSLDHNLEMKKWGCTTLQIAAVMIQSLGFGVELADLFRLIPVEKGEQLPVNQEKLAKLRVAARWISALASRGEAPLPRNDLDEALYPTPDVASRLISEVSDIRENPSRYVWLDRQEGSPEALGAPTPKPVPEQPKPVRETPPPPAKSGKQYTYADIPEELRSIISEDEFKAMDPEQARAFLADIGLE